MFIDSSEVEHNLRMSKKNSDQDSGDKIGRELELKEQHEQETFSLHFHPSYCDKNDDHPNNVQEECYNDMFSEDCNQQRVITNSFVDGFQEDFSLPIYYEYEDDYLDSLPKQPVEDLAISCPFTKNIRLQFIIIIWKTRETVSLLKIIIYLCVFLHLS